MVKIVKLGIKRPVTNPLLPEVIDRIGENELPCLSPLSLSQTRLSDFRRWAHPNNSSQNS